MAINIRVEDGLPITAAQARNILQHETDSFGLFLDLDRIIEYKLLYLIERKRHYDEYTSFVTEDISPSQTSKLRDWFMYKFNVPERLMLNKANKVAFDKDVRKNLLDANISDDAKHFIEVYNNWTYTNYRLNYLTQYETLPISYCVSDKGHRMVVANPTWNILATSRIAAEKPSIQNIARDMKDLVCCPAGWKLIRCDSGQIEPRITYSHYIKDRVIADLINLYNDAYYGLLHYCMLQEDVYTRLDQYAVVGTEEAKHVDEAHTIKPQEITDEMKAGRKELKVLALAANYGSALAGRDPVLSKRYTDRIVNNPARKLWEAEVSRQVKSGVDVFYSAFGSRIEPEETVRYRRGTASWTPHLVRCGINNPIQATASDLMICSVAKAKSILDTVERSHIAFYKHDEGAFYIHESEADIINDLKDVTAYNVTENGRPWIPIHSELEEGQLVNEDIPTVL